MSQARPPAADLARREFERILLVKPSSLGDVIHGLPVLHGLRLRYPRSRIEWLVNRSFAPLLDGHPEIDELIVFERRRYGRLAYSPAAAMDFTRFLGDLRWRRYDLVIDLQGLFRSGFITRATGAAVRIGFREVREGAWLGYTHYIPSAGDDAHAVDRNYRVAEMLGFADTPVEFPLPIDAKASATLSSRVGEHFGAADGPLVAVAPGARWDTKLWSEDRFADVVASLTADGARCVLLGGTEDEPRCRRIAESVATPTLNLAGRTSLTELVAAVGLADVVLCHDSAAAHIAAALNKQVVCVTGPTNPARTGPYRGGHVVRLDLDCSPCYLRQLAQCRHDHRCLRDLSAAVVLDAVRTALSLARTRETTIAGGGAGPSTASNGSVTRCDPDSTSSSAGADTVPTEASTETAAKDRLR